jgi:ADP-ribose pyrophosphatase YjhB (NUDIX family)
MKYTTGAGGIVLNKKKQILLITNGKILWGFPKGRVNPNETILETAKREIYEESGVKDLELLGDLGEYKRTQLNRDGTENPNIIKTIHMFLFITSEMKLKPIDKDIAHARWVDKEDIVNLLQHKKDKDFFNKIKDKI